MGDVGSANVHEIAASLHAAAPEELAALLGRYSADPRQGVRAAVAAARRRLDAYEAEYARTQVLYTTQDGYCHGIAIGVDEVGRGAIAGPLTVGAVVLPPEPIIVGLDDSKKLTPARREELARQIRASAIALGIAHIPPEDIDHDGMSASLHRAMREAVAQTGIEPDAVLIDGIPVHVHPKEIAIVKGDGRIAAIAAASIVAKVTRDALMVLAEDDYPGYGFASSKGYASAQHIEAIRERGLTSFHRATFCQGILADQQSLF